MNLLKANLSEEKIAAADTIRKNKDFCDRIVAMIQQTYDAVVSTSRSNDDVEYEIGRPGNYNMRGGLITDVYMKATVAGVIIRTSLGAFAFPKDYNPKGCKLGHDSDTSKNVGRACFGSFEMILQEGQKDLNKRFKDLNTVLQHCRFPIKL